MTSLMGYRRNDIVRIQLPPAMFQTVLVLLLLSVLSMTSLACSPPQTGRTLAERIRYSKQARVVYGKVAAIYYENKDADADEDRTDYAAASVQVYCSLMGNPVPPYINISLLGYTKCMGAAVIEEEDYVLLLSNRRDRWIPRDKQIPATSENLLELAAMCDLNIRPPQESSTLNDKCMALTFACQPQKIEQTQTSASPTMEDLPEADSVVSSSLSQHFSLATLLPLTLFSLVRR